MACPSYVPATDKPPSSYRSPPRRREAWIADRPGELVGNVADHSNGPKLGHQGPDQGFALTLARRFSDKLVLAPGERAADVLAGCCAVALRRASLFGRAPVVHDIRLALEMFGFLARAQADLTAWRGPLFKGAAGHHGYHILRHLADLPPDSTLRSTPSTVATARDEDWQRLLGLS